MNQVTLVEPISNDRLLKDRQLMMTLWLLRVGADSWLVTGRVD